MSEPTTGAEVFAAALETYGVDYVFGNPGTTELPVTTALEDSPVEYVLGLHEDIAVGMAAGYASTRRYHAHDDPSVNPVGVVNLHVTPGLAHGLGNLYNASWAGAPIVVTAGNHSLGHRFEEPILSGDLLQLVERLTKWRAEVLEVESLPMLTRRAFRAALTPPTGPVFLGLPVDVMLAETAAEPEPLGPIPNAGRGDPAAIDRAADLLVAADEPVAVLGDEVARCDAVDAAVDLAEAAGLRVHSEILATEVNFPSAHDQWASIVPPPEAPAIERMDADTLLFVGTSTHTTIVAREGPLVPPGATCIHVGPDAAELGKNQPSAASVIGDPGAVMAALADRVRERLPDDERERRLRAVARAVERFDLRGEPEASGDGRTTGDLVEALGGVAPGAFVVDGTVTAKYPLFAHWDFEPRRMIARKGGGLGYGICAAVGAAIAVRDGPDDVPVVGWVSEGSYLYYPHAVYTAARYGLDLTVLIPDNRSYRILKDNTLALLGGDYDDYPFTGMDFDATVDLPATARGFGAEARLVGADDDLEAAIAAAVDAAGPTVLDVPVTD